TSPFWGLISRSPLMTLGVIGIGVLSMASTVVVHLATLPVEFNASFARALPILDRGGYLPKRDLPAARRILRAAALTYVAGSLASLLNLWQWIRYLR
nr:zinc metallopeptidase [Kiloniellales bacterium]